MHFHRKAFFSLLLFSVAICGYGQAIAQKLLDKKVSVSVNRKPLKTVLDNISRQGGFYFSYISTTINDDSLVTVNIRNKTVRQTLEIIFGERFQYHETNDHVIIQPAVKEKWFAVWGRVTDRNTGLPLADASVFERQYLASTLTDAEGRYKLLLKETDKYAAAKVTVSMGSFYSDTTVVFTPASDYHFDVSLAPSDHVLDNFEITQYSGLERSWLGKHLFSVNLRKQSANLGKFFVDKPFQVSLTPGLGSHGKLSGQVTNAISFNAIGGYAAGVNGFELGGAFNIDKKDVKYVQIAGLFNIVNGKTTGLQIAGLTNVVNDSVKGLQISGINNKVRGSVKGMTITGIKGSVEGNFQGFQLSGMYNMVENRRNDTFAVEGLQLAGLRNRAKGNVTGMQLAGIKNRAWGDVHGVQAAFINRARKVKGVQIGFINVADSVDGYSIGFLNIIKKGYHVLSLSSNDVFNTNISFLGGNRRLYSIYTAGYNIDPKRRAFGLGYGIGTQLPISKHVAIVAELTSVSMYTDTANTPSIIKFRTGCDIRLAKKLSIHLGPSINLSEITVYEGKGYQTLEPGNSLYLVNKRSGTVAWIGWQAGINLF